MHIYRHFCDKLFVFLQRKRDDRSRLVKSLTLRDHLIIELPFKLIHTPRNINFDEFPSVRVQKDSPILATALIEDIDIFITGDKDLLVLEIDRPEIMTMKDFSK